jgi:8-oxo-dGTP pyrophosphatase MutT (NUDIX family)
MNTSSNILLSRINQSLLKGLPGESAHSKLALQHRKPASEYLNEITDYKIGCVISLIVKNNQHEWCLVLMERMSHEKDVHANQISFPGGKQEESDASYYDTALRELQEELGVSSDVVNLISPLSELYIPPSNFLVKPFLCYTHHELTYNPNDSEVRSLMEIPLSFFMQESNVIHGGFKSARGYDVNAPFYEYNSHKIWGATAMMIAEIVDLLKEE